MQFFDELRDSGLSLPGNRAPPPLFDFKPQDAVEVELHAGDLVHIFPGITCAQGWCVVTNRGATGLVPLSYVTRVDEDGGKGSGARVISLGGVPFVCVFDERWSGAAAAAGGTARCCCTRGTSRARSSRRCRRRSTT